MKEFTERFIFLPRGVLLLFFWMASFNWYDSNDPTPEKVTLIVNLIGNVSLMSWLYAIGQRSHAHLRSMQIDLKIMDHFMGGFILIIFTGFFTAIYGTGKEAVDLGFFYFTYHPPLLIALLYFSAWMYVSLAAAKALVSAETGGEAEWNGYRNTFFLLIFSWIGLWWVQPRIQKIPDHEETSLE